MNASAVRSRRVRVAASAIRRARACLVPWVLAWLLHLSPADAADWFVAPGGTPGGAGTFADPWDIGTALLARTVVGAGDTVWLRGGTYMHPDRSTGSKGWRIDLAGSDGAPVVIRNYNGERATIDGGLETNGGDPRHLRVWGLEIVVSENFTETRVSQNSGSAAPTDLSRPWGGIDLKTGYDITLVNNVIHANSQGVGFWKSVGGDSELYGNIIYDNGWIGPDRYHGPGIYTQNVAGATKWITDNLLLRNYSLPLQAYGSSTAAVDDYVFEGNIVTPKSGSGRDFMLMGGEALAHRHVARANVLYAANLRVGYTGGIDVVSVLDNTLSRSRIVYSGATNVTASGNWEWQSGDPQPAGPQVFLRPNAYESTRANLAILQWNGAAEVAVDLGGLLDIGDAYRILAAEDFYGNPVLQGVFSGGSVLVPLDGAEFGAFIVLWTAAGAAAAVPEPGAAMLLLLAALAVVARRGRAGR